MTEINKKEIAAAIIALQADLKPISKDSKGNWGKYASLAHVIDSINATLSKHGLAVIQPLDNLAGDPAIRTILIHESGESIEGTTPLILPKLDPQGQGSAITYARRYGLCSILGLAVDDDDDAQSATDKMRAVTQQSATKPVATKAPALPPVENVDDETFQKLCFLGSKLELSKEQSKKLWDTIRTTHGWTRGRYNAETTKWQGTRIPAEAIRYIVELFAGQAGHDVSVLLADFGLDALSDSIYSEDLSQFSDEIF